MEVMVKEWMGTKIIACTARESADSILEAAKEGFSHHRSPIQMSLERSDNNTA